MTGDAVPKIENLVDMLNRLIDPPVPEPIPFVPQTAGWWVLAALVSLMLLYICLRLWNHWKTNAYRRAALAELDTAGDDPAAIAGVLRRTALAAFPRQDVAGLTGDAWLSFLRDKGSISAGGEELVRAPYTGSATNVQVLQRAARIWIQSHRRTS